MELIRRLVVAAGVVAGMWFLVPVVVPYTVGLQIYIGSNLTPIDCGPAFVEVWQEPEVDERTGFEGPDGPTFTDIFGTCRDAARRKLAFAGVRLVVAAAAVLLVSRALEDRPDEPEHDEDEIIELEVNEG